MSRSLRITLLSLTLTTVFCIAPAKNEAFYTSVKSLGMAGAVAAHPLDSLLSTYNPGGLGFVGDRFDLGVHWAKETGKTQYSDNPLVDGSFSSHHGSENLVLPEFGINKCTCDIFTWGFTLYNRSFFKTNYPYANPLYGSTKLGAEYWHIAASITGSVVIARDHCLGITLDLHGQRLKVNGLEEFDSPLFSSHPHSVTNKGYDYSGGFGGTIGWMSRVSDCVSIGVAYSPKVHMSRLKDYKGLVADGGRVDIPQRVVGGVAIRMLSNFTVALDMEHINYNFIKPIHEPLFPELDDDSDEDENNSGVLLGNTDGSGLGWMDQMIFRLGVDWDVNEDVSLRCGYSYQRSPIHSEQTFANALTPFLMQQVVTVGGSLQYASNEISFYGAYALKRKMYGKRSIPEFLGGGEVNLSEEKWIAGLSWGRFF